MKTLAIVLMGVALSSCTVALGPGGKPRLVLDPEGVARAAEEFNERRVLEEK